jgi:phosphoglycerate dehydrogenase-like enzyme
MKIVACSGGFPTAWETLRRLLPEDEILIPPADALADRAREADVLVPAMGRVTGELMGPRLALIQQFGVGLEGVDLEEATRRKIPVANVPGEMTGNAAAVAEVVVYHLIGLFRDARGMAGKFAARKIGEPMGRSLAGKTIVLIGVGRIGRAVAARLAPFGCRLVGVGRRETPRREREIGCDVYLPLARLHDALAGADAAVLALPLDETTRGLIGAPEMTAMNRGGFLINVSRGGLVAYDALLSALRSGQLGGAGLDVYWTEPFPPDDPLLAENVLATPHIGGVTLEAYENMGRAFVENLERVRRGEPPLWCANAEVLPRPPAGTDSGDEDINGLDLGWSV